MRNWKNSSPPSAPCRLEWRPSRWLIGALLALAVLAPLSLLLSDLPPALGWAMTPLPLAWGLWLAWTQARLRPRSLVVPADGGQPVKLDGRAVESLQVHWRGPLAFLDFGTAGGCRQRLAFWPDTLPPSARRELRLAVAARNASSPAQAVAT